MHIAYSALNKPAKRGSKNRSTARFRGYMDACDKHSDTIAAIRQYLPGWTPDPPGTLKGEQLKLA